MPELNLVQNVLVQSFLTPDKKFLFNILNATCKYPVPKLTDLANQAMADVLRENIKLGDSDWARLAQVGENVHFFKYFKFFHSISERYKPLFVFSNCSIRSIYGKTN